MSAIDIHVGTQFLEDRDAPLTCDINGQPLEAARRCVPKLEATHNGLTRTVWIRRTIEDLMQGRSIHIADGGSLGKKDAKDRARLYFVLDPPFLQYEIPWMPAATEVTREIAMIGMSGKMACPTWDLPAGSPLVGGSCPGATAGQSIVPLRLREKANAQAPIDSDMPLHRAMPDPSAGPVGQPVRLRETICELCYAVGGNYLSPHVQVGEVVRYWWTRDLIESGADGRAEWVQTVVRAIRGESWKTETQADPRTGTQIYPMRVHSSGDFFSRAYAEAWIAIANELPEIMFWAPTRTWAARGWMEIWRELVPMIAHGNFAIRPSAYHTGDPAPGPHDHPWPGDYVFPTAGTTSIYKFDDATPASARGVSIDPRYDWSCQTYAILNDAHSCRNALAPDGRVGCRACWLHPDLRVNYTTH